MTMMQYQASNVQSHHIHHVPMLIMMMNMNISRPAQSPITPSTQTMIILMTPQITTTPNIHGLNSYYFIGKYLPIS